MIDEQCFYSECASKYSVNEYTDMNHEKYKLQIKVIVYLAENRSKFEIWELNVFCGVDNCSRPTIFEEVTNLLSIDVSNLTSFPVIRPSTLSPWSTTTTNEEEDGNLSTITPMGNSLECYKCLCLNSTCPCMTVEAKFANLTHCMIAQSFSDHEIYTEFTHVSFNSTQSYIREFPYILVQESIRYNKTIQDWVTITDFIIYGCNWNSCNRPHLLPHLSGIFKTLLSKSWLNMNVLNTELSERNCNHCPHDVHCIENDVPDLHNCPSEQCNGTCFLSNKYNHLTINEQCYRSYCGSSSTSNFEIDSQRVVIQAILYLNRSQFSVELWEILIPCHGIDCSRLKIFQEVSK
jgi:hypothetical protein